MDGTGFAVPDQGDDFPDAQAFKVMVFRKFPTTMGMLRDVVRERAAPAFAYVPDPDCLVFVEMLLNHCVPGAVLDDLVPTFVVPDRLTSKGCVVSDGGDRLECY